MRELWSKFAFSMCFILVFWPASGVAEDYYELQGKLLRSDGTVFRRLVPVIFLHGATHPYSAHTLVNQDGSFTFKKIRPGMYMLIVAVPEQGEMHRTIDVSPSFADKARRIKTTFHFEANYAAVKKQTVSVRELSIPDNAKREQQKALDLLSKHDIDGAAEHLKKAVELAPQFTEAWNLLGTIAYQSKNFEQAEMYFREALKQDPDAYAPIVNLGGALLSLGKPLEALPLNRRAVEARPDDPLAHSQLGLNYYMLGQFQLAERYLKQTKTLDRGHFSLPQLTLSRIYRRQQDYPALVGEIEEFLELHPDSELAPEMERLLQEVRRKSEP